MLAGTKKRREWKKLVEDTKKSQQNAFAPGTFDNLTYQWVRYLQFSAYFELQPLPATTQTLTWYAQFTANKVKSHATVVAYLSGVKTLHKLLNLDTSAFSSFTFKLTIRGLRRGNDHVPRQAAPITPKLLEKMYDKLDFSKEKDRLFWAVSILAFLLLFRKSNLVPDKKSEFNPDKQLTWKDLTFFPGRVECAIRWTKTNQYRDEILTFPLYEMPNSKLCPIRALKAIKQGKSQDAHCFALQQGGSYTYRDFNSKLKTVIQSCGEDGTAFSSHSYRHGGCTWAFLSGVPLPLIRTLGNWSSDCYLRYLHYPREARAAASQLMKLRLQAAGF